MGSVRQLVCEGVEKQVESLAHAGMGEHGVADPLVRQVAEHGDLKGGDDLAGVGAEKRRTEDLVGVASTTAFQLPVVS